MSSEFRCFHWNIVCPFFSLLLRFFSLSWFQHFYYDAPTILFFNFIAPGVLVLLDCVGYLLWVLENSQAVSFQIFFVPLSFSPFGLQKKSQNFCTQLIRCSLKEIGLKCPHLSINIFILSCCNFAAYQQKIIFFTSDKHQSFWVVFKRISIIFLWFIPSCELNECLALKKKASISNTVLILTLYFISINFYSPTLMEKVCILPLLLPARDIWLWMHISVSAFVWAASKTSSYRFLESVPSSVQIKFLC